MASAPQNPLPIFYNDLMPLSSQEHAKWTLRPANAIPFVVHQHAVPITSDEFIPASRHFPIIFSVGENPVPLALMGLNDGVNVFFDDKGTMVTPAYLPAYIRRYPFLLARLQEGSDDLSLCFDPTSDVLGAYKDGEPLFDGTEPSATTKNILDFCQQFEESGARTGLFMEELKELGLLMDGEVAIQQDGNDQPFVYRGFQMVDEEKLRDMHGDKLRKINQNGMLPLLYAHLQSLQLVRDIFAIQMQQGKVPAQTAA